MAYYFMLGVVPLPITPGALTIKTPSMNQTINLANEGEINIPKDRGLREISFDFLLPQVQKYPFANYQLGSYTATTMIPLLNMWKQTRLPFQFIVVRTSPKGKILYFTSIKCLIEDYTYEEDAEEHGLDVLCSIELKEYKDYGTKSVKLKEVKNSDGSTTKTASQTTTRSTTGKKIASSTKTTSSDTLPNVSKKVTGTFDYTNDFAIENGIVPPEIDSTIADIADPSTLAESGSTVGEAIEKVDPLGGITKTVEDKTLLAIDNVNNYVGGMEFELVDVNGLDKGVFSSMPDIVTTPTSNILYKQPGTSGVGGFLMGGL